jgi:hypothetical protein
MGAEMQISVAIGPATSAEMRISALIEARDHRRL